jgi:ATP-dependent DNA helicase RecG
MSAKEVDKALASHADAVGSNLAKLSEGQWFDRKSVRTHPKDLAQHLVAFANADGGVIVVGIHNGIIEGTMANWQRDNDIRQASIDHTVPPVRATVDHVDCINSEGKRDTLIVIRIDPGEVVHELKNGDCFPRVGDESRRLRHDQRQELEYDKGVQYDGTALPEIDVSDLDKNLLQHYREATGATNTTKMLLKARSLLTRQDVVTRACYLLFGPHPQDLFPQAYIRILKYSSTERGTGSRLTIQDENDIRIEGPIPLAIPKAAREIERLVPTRRALRENGLFESEPIVPKDAWLEGMVNAVIHRSYSLAGDHIRVEIYPDRIEIESPGRFPGLANPSRPLDISRYARNPRIARVCADLKIGQELGEGIKRIFEEMRRVGLTDPVYQQGQGSVRLKLEAVQRIDRRTAARLPDRSQFVVDAMRSVNHSLSTGDIAEIVGMSRPWVKVRLRALQEEGLVEWVGKSPQDPRAVWTIIHS